jgi:hypothetical protein
VFGCKAFAHIPKDERRKLDAKLIKYIFIGYCTHQKAYKLFDPKSHKFLQVEMWCSMRMKIMMVQ